MLKNKQTNAKKKLRKVKKHWVVIASMLAFATIGAYSNQINPTTSAAVTMESSKLISNQTQLISALNDSAINEIKLANDIKMQLDEDNSIMQSTRFRFPGRNLKIDLNHHTLDLNDFQFKFNYENKNERLTVNRGQIKGMNESGSLSIYGAALKDIVIEFNAVVFDGIKLINDSDISITINSEVPADEKQDNRVLQSSVNEIPDSNANASNSSESTSSHPVTSNNENSSGLTSSASSEVSNSDGESSTSASTAESSVSSHFEVNSSLASDSSISQSSATSSSYTSNNSVASVYGGSYIYPLTRTTNQQSSVVNNQGTLAKINDSPTSETPVTYVKSTEFNYDQGPKQPKSQNNKSKKAAPIYLKAQKGKQKQIKVYRNKKIKLTNLKKTTQLSSDKKYKVLDKQVDKKGRIIYKINLGYIVGNNKQLKIIK